MSHAEKQSVEARNAELQRSLQQCGQKEALERQEERGRRALRAGGPPGWATAPGPRRFPTPGTSLIRGR